MPYAIAAAVIIAAVLFSLWRRRGGWGRGVLAVVAGGLFLALLRPPSIPVGVGTLTVITPGATPQQLRSLPWLAPVVALPGAGVAPTVARVPDLATALRQRPETVALRVLGQGLPLRDQGVSTLPMSFDAAPARGLVALQGPLRGRIGGQWRATGRLAAPAVRVELRDPAATVIDTATAAADGSFNVSAALRAAGPARFELRALAVDGAVVETAALPVWVEAGESFSAAARLGAPDPEFKYWRRWAADARIALAFSAGVSEGVVLHAGDAAFDAAHLSQWDFVVVDERAWATLNAAEKGALRAAVDAGLGLLLRIAGPVPDSVIADWRGLGVEIENLDAPQTVTLDRATGGRDRADFTVAPARPDAAAWTPLLTADDGTVVAGWRAQGQGRIGYWRLLDSYRLQLGGESARYGALAAQVVGALSRPRAQDPEPAPIAPGWLGERMVLCGLGAAAEIRGADGAAKPLYVDAQGCAAYWPLSSGWQWLRSAGSERPLFVRDNADATGLRAARDGALTRARATAPGASGVSTRKNPLPRWPIFVVWLMAVSGLWWLERRLI